MEKLLVGKSLEHQLDTVIKELAPIYPNNFKARYNVDVLNQKPSNVAKGFLKKNGLID